MDDVVKVTVHVKDVANCDRMNTVYESFFDDYLPARIDHAVAAAARILVNIDAIAYLPGR
jgi:2-iminobutanoate/2-iminopropanoate deaminase